MGNMSTYHASYNLDFTYNMDKKGKKSIKSKKNKEETPKKDFKYTKEEFDNFNKIIKYFVNLNRDLVSAIIYVKGDFLRFINLGDNDKNMLQLYNEAVKELTDNKFDEDGIILGLLQYAQYGLGNDITNNLGLYIIDKQDIFYFPAYISVASVKNDIYIKKDINDYEYFDINNY